MAARMARLLESPTPVLSGPGHQPLEPDLVKSYSLAAVMSIAIHPKLGEPWILAIQHSKQDHVWTEAESRLLQVIAGRIGDSLTSLLSLRDLRESEARLRTVVEHAPEAIVVFDAERQLFVDANANALQLFALTRDALCKLGPSDLSPPTQPDGTDSNEAARRYIQHAVDGEIPSFEWTHRNAEGRDIPCEVRLVRLPAGDRVLLRGSLSDISERKRSEQELAHYRNHLEELVEQRTNELERSRQNLLTSERLASLGTLAAGIAHQINNPLGSILNGAEFALLSEDDPERKQIWKRALEDNVEQALRCGQIVKSVLLFSRGETIEKHVGDVVALVRRTCELSDRYAEDAEAVVELSAPAEPIHVLMSEIEIEQVLVNLIHNAVESRDSGARVEVRVVLDGDAVRIEVADDGRGIPVDVQSKIFDPFFTTRLKAGGTGLGLSVAHGILANHGGSIDVQSRPGRGTTVSVTLHRADPNAPVGMV
jgi:PAS domain S-box-containing protein